MPNITYEGQTYQCSPDENLLDSLNQHGVLLPSGCRSGSCHACLCTATQGKPPSTSQIGLKDTLKAQNFFLPCICKPQTDLAISLNNQKSYSTTVLQKEWLNDSTIALKLKKPDTFQYYAGQFINLTHHDGTLMRSYSLASIPQHDFLELHIKRIPDGKMSNWLCDHVSIEDKLSFTGASGDCFYLPENPQQTLVLAGTGTGLAPLYGILHAALAARHKGDIYIYHGSLATEGLYYQEQLYALSSAHDQIHYVPCVLHGEAPHGGKQGALDILLGQALSQLTQTKTYLCGDPALVQKMQQTAFLSGVSMKDIYADAFTFSP